MTSMGELIRAYAASDPWTVAGFVVLLTAATAVGVIGLTKATATLSFQVSTGAKRAAIITVGVLVLLMVVQRLLMFGVDRLDHAMSTQFREFTTARLMRDVVETNRTTLHDVHPLRYRAYVEASVASSFQVFDACLKTYLPNGVMLVALAAYLFYLDVRYGAALLATLAFAVLAFFAHKDHLAQKTREAEARSHAATTFTYDVLSCIDTVVAKNTHVQELAGVEAALRESAEGTRALGLTMDVGNLVMSGAIIAGVAVITLIGVTKLGMGTSAPAVLAMLGLVSTLRYRIGSIAAANSAIVGQTSRFEANALPHVSSRPTENTLGQKELCEGGRTCAGPVRVDFEHVSFKYPGTDRQVIADFSWSIGPGINVLSAKSGRGKTTLASLVLRLYTPDSGLIRVNGVPLSDLSVDSLRANIVFSSQDMGLLDRTIREVCLYGTTATDQDLAEVWETFKDCFQGISLDDRIGQSGGRMSTGMKQVIRLTNIRLSKSPCILLDEPFSGLDAENRDAAIGLVRAIAASGRTVLLITHEPDVMLLADNSVRL
jgi:ABC-type multidrug transport system fused ATPase/permease subunit